MKKTRLTKLGSLFLGLSMALGVGAAISAKKVSEAKAANKITTVAGITSGSKYYIGATTGGNDYYLSVDGSATTASIAGAAVDSAASATPFIVTSTTGGYTFKFDSSDYYLSLKNGKDNGKVQVVSDPSAFTIANNVNNGLLTISIGSYSIQKNNSGAQFGSYANTQTDVWLMAADSGSTTTYTLTLNSNNGSGETSDLTSTTSSTFTLPDCEFDAPNGKQFKGWSTSQTDEVITGTTYTISSGTTATLYAIWEDASSTSESSYTKVESSVKLTDGKYLIVYETGSIALDGSLTSDVASNTVPVVINNKTIKGSSTIDSAALTFTASNGSFLGSGGKYVGHSGSSNTLNYSNSALENTVSIDGDKNAVIAAGDYVMRYNASSGQERFRYYKSGQQSIQLYKLDSGEPQTYTVTYHTNDYTGGSAPTDANEYSDGSTVTVLGNTANLQREGYTWSGWSINEDGTGTAYGPTYTKTIAISSSNIDFYPIWVKNIVPLPASGTITIDAIDNINGGTGYAAFDGTHITDVSGADFNWVSNNVMAQSGKIQFRSTPGYLYNTTPLEFIQSIEVTVESGSITTYYGTTEQPTESTSIGLNDKYFRLVATGTTVVTSIVIKYGPIATLESIAVSSNNRSFYIGDDFVPETVTATYSDASTKEVEATFSGYDMSSVGTQTVSVSYTERGITRDTTYEITVSSDTLLELTLGGSVSGLVGNDWDLSNVTLTGTYQNSGDKEITDFEPVTTTANPTKGGTYTVHIGVTYSGITAEKDYTVVVPKDGRTEEDAISVSDALAYIDDLGIGNTTDYGVYVIGNVLSVDKFNDSYHSVSLTLADENDSTKTITVYSVGQYQNGDPIADGDIEVGMNLTVFGQLINYNKSGSSVPEIGFVNGSTITPFLKINPIALTNISVTESISINEGKTATISVTYTPENASNKNVSYVSGDSSIALVDADGVVTGVKVGTTTITVTSEDGNHTDTCAVTVTEAPATDDYELVTDASSLSAGDKLLIVGVESDVYYAIAPYESGNNCKRAEVPTPKDDVISLTDENTGYAQLTLGGAAGNWTLFDGTYYLYAAGGTGSNYLKGAANADALTAQWSISVTNDGVATIKCADTTTTKNWIRHNTGSDLFSCYASGQADVYLYKLVEDTPALADGRYYLMSADGHYGLSAEFLSISGNTSPAAVDLTASNELNAFNVEYNTENKGYKIYLVDGGLNYLQNSSKSTNSSVNNNIRISDGTGYTDHTEWILEPVEGGFIIKQNTTDTTYRYLGLHDNQDWYGYLDENSATVVKFVEEGSIAADAANSILNDLVCDNGVTPPSVEVWNSIASSLTIAYEKALLTNGTANASSESEIEKALAKYDYIVGKYGSSTYADFLDRGPTSPARYGLSLGLDELKDSTWIVAVVAIAGLTAIGGCFFYRKRKQY